MAAARWRGTGPQLGENYHPVIEEIDDGPSYSRAALGKVVDAGGQSRRVLVTVGPTSMFAYIDTPEGAYELVADNKFDWLIPTASMMAGFDFSKSDYILLENDGMAWAAHSDDADEAETDPSEPYVVSGALAFLVSRVSSSPKQQRSDLIVEGVTHLLMALGVNKAQAYSTAMKSSLVNVLFDEQKILFACQRIAADMVRVEIS